MGADLVTIVRNFSIDTQTFTAGDGSVEDGCVSPGTHRLLHFDFLTHNVGDVDLHIGPPPPPPPPDPPTGSIFVWSNSHHHYHIKNFNNYSLLNTSDPVSYTHLTLPT